MTGPTLRERLLRFRVMIPLLALGSCKSPEVPPRLDRISPRVISNQTSYPVMLYGERLPKEAVLIIRTDPPTRIPTVFLDSRHLSARIPERVMSSSVAPKFANASHWARA